MTVAVRACQGRDRPVPRDADSLTGVDELAVFPLPIVVFPGMTVPLHVFEERYKRLVRHAGERTPARFLVAPPPGEALDEDGAGRPGDVGTLIEVLEVTENLDGTYAVLGHGRSRQRLRQVREERVAEHDGAERPLWFAQAEPWPLERGDPNQERVVAWDTLEAFRRYGDAYFAPRAQRQAEESLPHDPLYQASFVCANLRLPPLQAQRLLEAPSLSDRLRAAREAVETRLTDGGPTTDGDDAAAAGESGDGDLAGSIGDELDEAFAEELEADLAAIFGGFVLEDDDEDDEDDDEVPDERDDGVGSA